MKLIVIHCGDTKVTESHCHHIQYTTDKISLKQYVYLYDEDGNRTGRIPIEDLLEIKPALSDDFDEVLQGAIVSTHSMLYVLGNLEQNKLINTDIEFTDKFGPHNLMQTSLVADAKLCELIDEFEHYFGKIGGLNG